MNADKTWDEIKAALSPADHRTRYAELLMKLHLLIADGTEPPEAAAIREEMTACSEQLNGPVIDEMHRLSAAIRGALATPAPAIPDRREVLRLLTYRGTTQAIAEQLGKSLPDGLRSVKKDTVEIEVKTLSDQTAELIASADPVAALLECVTQLELQLSQARLAARTALRSVEHHRQEADNARANLAQWQSVHNAKPTP